MDAITQHHQELNRVRQAWAGTRDSVRRMALLREWFRVEHRLLNELLAQRVPAPAGEIQECSTLLESIPEKWRQLSAAGLREHLEKIKRLPDDLEIPPASEPAASEPAASKPSESRLPDEKCPLPDFLERPDRVWERLIFLAAKNQPEWTLTTIDETLSLREFAERAKDREAELSRNGIVLAVNCLTPQGELRSWRWQVLVLNSGPDQEVVA